MNPRNCSSLLHDCGNLGEVKQIHAQAVIQALCHFQPLSCIILNAYAKFRKTPEALLVFRQIQDPDVVTLTSLISLYLQTNRPHEAFSTFSNIVSLGLKPDRFAVVGALSACGRKQDLGNGKTVHGMIYRLELGSDTFVGNALIDMYCRNNKIQTAHLVFSSMGVKDVVSWTSLLHGHIKCRDLQSAYRVFEEMPHRNVISWTAMITGYVQGFEPLRALQFFYWMKTEGEIPTVVTMVGVFSACADIGALDLGQSIHCYICKTNMDSDITVLNSLMDMYSKSGSVETAEKIFKCMSEKDVYSWTTIILCFAVHGFGRNAVRVFSEMLEVGIRPNEITFVAVLSACSHSGLVDEGLRLFDRMRQFYHLEATIEHYGCMVDLLGRAGLLEEAERLIRGMQIDPDGLIWRSLMSACLVHGNIELAVKAGKKIIELEPGDDGVHVLLWNIFASANRWQEALEVRRKMKDQGVNKKPGCSWIEVNGVVQEFLVQDKVHHLRKKIYLILEGINKQMSLNL